MNALFVIAAHLCGDFLLQNHWMQRKGRHSGVCAVHVAAYLLPWAPLTAAGIVPLWILAAIAVEHFLQDRFRLHIRWMHWYGHTDAAAWPQGPLCVDQAMHLSFIGLLFFVQSLLP